MKITLTESDFLRAWADSSRADQFSRAALRAMFDYLEELERDTGEEMELDIIALCCDWTEWETVQYAAAEHGWEAPERGEEESGNALALEWLEYRTHVIEYDSGVLVLDF